MKPSATARFACRRAAPAAAAVRQSWSMSVRARILDLARCGSRCRAGLFCSTTIGPGRTWWSRASGRLAGEVGPKMNVRRSQVIELDGSMPVTDVLEAYCAEFEKDDPSRSEQFTVGLPDPAWAAIVAQPKDFRCPPFRRQSGSTLMACHCQLRARSSPSARTTGLKPCARSSGGSRWRAPRDTSRLRPRAQPRHRRITECELMKRLQ
jgi:hypothetical protein